MSDRIGSESFDALGDRMKGYEMAEAGRAAMPGLPVVARLDGRAFHTFTRGLQRPFDPQMGAIMQYVTKGLVEEFHPDVGYTQSDEITLVWRTPTLFSGRFQKLTSVLAGYASALFAKGLAAYFCRPEYQRQKRMVPCFDCRVFQVPDLFTVIDVLAWREYDAVKNSVSMAAQSVYSHKALHKKGRADQMDMLHAKGINWNDYPAHFKRGIYFKRYTVEKELTQEELEAIPEKHRPTGPVLRSEVLAVKELEAQPIRKLGNILAIPLLFPVDSVDPNAVV
jgi:tRNA(His) 5'-end guanylyltransferase